MTTLLTLLRMRWTSTRSALRGRTRVQKGIMVAFVFILMIFGAAVYGVGFGVFRFLRDQDVVGQPLSVHILHLGFFTFSAMLVVSNVISSIPTLLRSREALFLFTYPISAAPHLSYQFTSNLFYSSWATVLLGFPLLISFGAAYHAAWWYYPAVLAALICLVTIAAALGALITVLIASFRPRFSWKHVVVVTLMLAASSGLYLARTSVLDNVVFPQVESFTAFNRLVGSIGTAPPYVPSTWLVDVAKGGVAQDPGTLLFALALLASTAAATVHFLLLASPRYHRAVEHSWEGNADAVRAVHLVPSRLARMVTTPFQALFLKDARNFVRQLGDVSQLLLLGILLLTYIVLLSRLPVLDSPAPAFWSTIISYVNFGVTGYITATYAVRFLFPAMSLEGRSSWMLWAAPIHPRAQLASKFLLGTVPLLVITIGLTLWSSYVLDIQPSIQLVFLVVTILLTLALSAFSLGMGAIAPNFHEDNPSRLSTSGVGLITVLISLVYVAATILLLAAPLSRFFEAHLSGQPFSSTTFLPALAGVTLISAAVGIIPIIIGRRRMHQYDF